MKKLSLGLLLGSAAGAIDIIPMLVQKLPWSAECSAFSMWVVVGFFLSTSTLSRPQGRLRMPGPLLGVLIAFLCLLPALFIIGSQQPASLVPIIAMTLVLGSALGWLMRKLGG